MAKKAQRWLNSCGAASLMCAARELGIAALPANIKLGLWDVPTRLDVNDECETRIYQMTGSKADRAMDLKTLRDLLKTNPKSDALKKWDYSLPTDILACARHIGLKGSHAVAYKTKTVTALKIAFGSEWQKIKKDEEFAPQDADHSTITPKAGERELKVLLSRKYLALHYVMVRPDGSVMEPATGHDFRDTKAVKNFLKLHGTGLSVFVSR